LFAKHYGSHFDAAKGAMSLHVLAYNLKRMLQIFDTQMLVAFIKASAIAAHFRSLPSESPVQFGIAAECHATSYRHRTAAFPHSLDPMLPVLALNLKPQNRHRPAPRAASGGGAACLAVFGVAAHQSVQADPLMSAHSVQ
jgi:hypothetical protein